MTTRDEKAEETAPGVRAELAQSGNRTPSEARETTTMGKKAKRVNEAGVIVSVVPDAPKTAEAVRVCPCGCETRLGKKRVFEQGHDARIRGWFVAVSEGEKEVASLPPVLQAAFPLWQGNGAGAFVKAAVVAAQAN